MLEINALLAHLGQTHLSCGFDSLPPQTQRAFFETLKNYGLPTLQRQRAALDHPPAKDLSSFSPLSAVHRSGSPLRQQWGQRLMAEGKVGCLILAGGQGTRLGFDGPKGMFPISPIAHKSLFQILSERAVCASKRAQRVLPVAIMTSPINDAPTRAYFENHTLFGLERDQLDFFTQKMLPFIDERGNWLLQEPGKLAEGPDGNGGAFSCFYEQGLWDEWRQSGVEYVNVLFVDNPLADPFDAEFIGFTAQNDLDIGMKVVERQSTAEQMGIAARRKERLCVIEYSEFSADASASYLFASPGLFCFSMDFIRSLCEKNVQLPLHLARKNASIIAPGSTRVEQRSIFKCETFQFDLLECTEKSAAICFPRQRVYAPVKNAQGEKSPRVAEEALSALDRYTYTQLSGLPAPSFAFELDPAFYYPSDELKRKMKGLKLPECSYIAPEILDLLQT